MKTQRRAGAAAAALLLGGAGVLLAPSTAQAAVIDVQYDCKTPIGDKSAVSPIDIKGVKEGDGYKLTMSFQKGVSSSPIQLGAGAMTPSAVIVVDGAEKTSVPVTGPANAEPIPANTPIKISDLSGTYTPKKSGKVTFTAGVLTIKAMGTTTTCTPGNNPKPSLELDVTAPGGTTGGTTGSTTTGGTTGGSTTGGSTTGGSTTGSTTTGGSTTGGSTSGGSTTGGSTTGGSTTGGSTAGGSTTGGSGGQTDFPGKAVDVTYDCGAVVPGGIKTPVTISAKKNGGDYALTVKTAKGAMASPMQLPAGALKPSMDIKLGGADSGTVKVTGPANAEPIPNGAPVSLTDMTGTYKPGKSGKVTLTPDQLTIDVTMAPGSTPINVPCKATASGVSLELDTTAQPGGSGSTTAGGSSAAASGGLAETGAQDDGGIKALALVAGTVILLGGAVFTFTPWRRLRGTR
ncbi:hypothetical protein EDD96_4740 [Streptomyces sp. Ag109_G2-6]|uniref:hypothetical protein n=1 Tax=Streptomyces TaxID=1883 RepID=UPI0009A4A30B|nr:MULTISPECIES: hypothetical protein [Streptomyces]RPF40955.1 hypothetical protein EDD96_4740 [Streptomyces sp. Ag109_G2-6]